ncbi:ubiquitin-protein ligase / HECT11 [Leishmania donovani]|uniref:SPRY_domain_containing_protein_putative/Pfam:PF00 622 n=1 Tax=Leishmania donovani TaxID=5661 RepID=A0A6J8FSC2_LEIDO|nr:ubiquitin-protein ligase / HECT11 [Leishmania donovani]VDZ49182.1 SPRY_domain_containing_protein_putative/Pfam:PF00622 [Leishmania donovani]
MESQSSDFSELDVDEAFSDDHQDSQTRVLSDDEDYSSDSSEHSTAARAAPAEGSAQRSAGQRSGRARGIGSESLRPLRESSYPVEYLFAQTTLKEKHSTEVSTVNEEKRVGLKSLGGLVKYSSADLLTRAWCLCPSELKNREHPLYSKLPKCPEVLETRFGDTDEISQFMCSIALQLGERYHRVTPVYLRSLLVQAVVRDEIAGANQSVANSTPYADVLLDPAWEGESACADEADDVSGNEGSDEVQDENIEVESAVSAFDFSVALILPVVSQGITYESLHLLHTLVDRCLSSSTEVAVLRSWGVRRIMRLLLRHMNVHAGQSVNKRWLATTISLLSKIVLSSGDTKVFFSLLRWSLHHPDTIAMLHMRGVRGIVERVEQKSAVRVRLSIPTVTPKEQTISFIHSVGSTPASVTGLCVFTEEDAPRCIVFTENRSFKVALTPPFEVLCCSSTAPDSCRGVYVESDMSICVLGDHGKVFVINKDTLMLTRTMSPPSHLLGSTQFPLYIGDGEYVSSYFLAGTSTERQACFTGNEVSGALTPSTITLPRTCDSLSIQFYLCPVITGTVNEMTLLHLTTGSKNWLSVSVSLNPLTSTMVLMFRHGQDAFAEIREPLRAEWALWSASLTSTNDTAAWSVFKNGVMCDTRSQSGALIQPSGAVTPIFFKGRLNAHLSTLQLWSRAQSVDCMRNCALEHTPESKSQFLVFSFLMDEGLGRSFHSPQTGYVWQGTGVIWDTPPRPFPVNRHSPHKVHWRPSGNYYIVTNHFEYAIIEPQATTWIDRDGRVVEQAEGLLSVSERPFYNITDGYFFLSTQDTVGIRSVKSNSPPAAYLQHLPSMVVGKQFCAQVVESVMRRTPITAKQYLEYLVHRTNLHLLTYSDDQGSGPVHLSSSLRENLSVVGRLLDLTEYLVSGIESSVKECLRPELLLCLVGRVLNIYVKLFERQCPGQVVRSVVDAHKRLQSLNTKVKQDEFLQEAASVFGDLNQVILARCVSHDFQLKLITDSASLKDVRQLLQLESLSQFVASVIKRDMKKMFMTFLHRLKEECQEEATLIFDSKPRQINASEAMLSTLLGMLSQQGHSQWHLVAAALISSLCKWIIRCFEERYPSDAERYANVDVLKETSIGIVLFPVVHYMCDMQLDSSIAPDALKALNDARKCLSRYSLAPGKTGKKFVSFSETHYVASPPQLKAPFYASLSLQYAKSIKVEFLDSPELDRASSTVTVSLVTNNCLTSVDVLHPGQNAVFLEGAQVSIAYAAEATLDSPAPGVALNVHTVVELATEKTDWVRDICLALSYIIIRVTQHNLHNTAPSGSAIRRDSFLRGGLSASVQKCNKIPLSPGNKEECADLHAQLCAVAEETDPSLTVAWSALYEKSRIQYSKRLEGIMRWASCALAWQTLSLPAEDEKTVEQLLCSSVNAIKRKTFLLLEALQQGREEAIVGRARFLLFNITPRLFGEWQLIEHQHTEEPLTAEADRGSRQLSRLAYSVGNRSRATVASFQMPTAHALDLSSNYRGSLLSTRKTASRTLDESPVNIFTKTLRSEEESLPNKIIYYLINGLDKPTEDICKDMVLKTQQAVYQTEAYKLQEDLCKSFANDREMLSAILMTHLKYRLEFSQSTIVAASEQGEAASEANVGFDHHYTEQMIGCGMLRELELQKAVCSFVQSSLRSLLHKLDDTQDFPYVEAVYMCATLCHPWDGVDMSILQPREIFAFLKKLLTTACELRLESASSDTDKYYESRGLFDLAHRCLVIPNAMLQTSVEGVHIVQSEVQGLHVENVNVVFSARTHWKAHGANVRIPTKTCEADYYANYGIPKVISEFPDVQYYEVALDFALHPSNPELSMGLSLVPLSPLDPVRADYVLSLASTGRVHRPEKQDRQLCNPWKVGDVVGCGLMAPSNSVFFTLNGEFLGVVAEVPTLSTVIPFVSVRGDDTLMKVIVNFGEEQSFRFDLASLHCSCRHRYLTPSVVCDTVIITTDYLVTMCYKGLSKGEDTSVTCDEAISGLLEKATAFLSSSTITLMVKLNACSPGQSSRIEQIVVLLSRLLHCVSIVIECFRYDAVTRRTHATVLQLCAAILTRCRDKWVKVRASQCLAMLCKILRPQYLVEASEALRGLVSFEDIVQQLVDLARIKFIKEAEAPMQPPRWVGGTTVVKGKGTFFGSVPLPKKGTHLVGFRIKRRQQQVQGPGAPLGGCYYLGLAHGQPSIPNMGNLISRSDVYVLQDTDDQDQVAHLLLRRHCIPRNNHRRVYGNDEVVWVEFNADYGEIAFYRENMVMIGLAFANITQVDDLYPIAFLFNDDASCEIIAPPSLTDESVEHWTESLRRSAAIDTLQELHVVPGFSAIISLMVQRSVSQLDCSLDECLVALGVLGGERSYLYCQHDTYGMVVVHAIAEVTGKVVVFLASDEDKRLFSVQPQGLKPSFIQTPLYQSNAPDAHSCATLLSSELYRILYEASAVAPLLQSEEGARHKVERQYEESLSSAIATNLIGILTEQQMRSSPKLARAASTSPETSGAEFPYRRFNSSVIFSGQSVSVDLHCSTKTLYVPNPSIAVTTAEGCSVVRGNVQLDQRFTLAVSVTQTSINDLMYVGFTTTRMRWPESQDEVASWEDAWVLCNRDSVATNSVNCCMEPGIIFGAANKVFQSGDVLLMRVDRHERTVAFTRIRNSEQTDLGVLFEGIPAACDLRPMVVCGEESVVVFSTLDSCLFPSRLTYPVSNFNNPSCERVTCCSCSRRLMPPWYGSEDNVALCEWCFSLWKRPKDMFFVVSTTSRTIPEYLVSDHCPETLVAGDYVEFEENTGLQWSNIRSVNSEILGGTCIALNDESFAFSEELPQFGQRRVDVRLSHIAGVPGHPFSGLHTFTPLWRDGQQIGPTCSLRGDCVAVSATMLPMRTKLFLCFHIESNSRNTLFSMAEVFVGVTNLADAPRPMSRADLEHLCAAKSVRGTWCDTSEKVSSSGCVNMLVDCLNSSVFFSSSLSGLHGKPFVISGSMSAEAEEDNLRLLVFSHEPCVVRFSEGLVSYNECVEPSFAPLAIGLFPEMGDALSVDTFNEAIVLMDTVDRTQTYTKAEWRYSPHVDKLDNGTLFYVGDTVTFFHDGTTIHVYIQGIELASLELSDAQRSERLRVVAYLSTRGTTATIVPPLYGTSHFGKITRVCSPDVAVVESVSEHGKRSTFAVHKSAVRFCALVAAAGREKPGLCDGDPVAFKIGGLQISKRGTIASVQGAVVNVCESSDKRNLISVNMNQCFLLRNEGKQQYNYELYPLISPPTSSITRVFEVGKKKFRLQSRGSYNGIMFDCKTSETIELIGMSVLTRVTGCHQVQTYFRKGSSVNHERDGRSWTVIFDDMIDMTADHQFSIPFTPITVEGGTTFSFYINTSHNCGIGFYCEEDGCSGEIGQELDADGTLSVYLGRKSGSSDPFTEFSMSPRGFCGTIQYKQNHGSTLPSIEGKLFPRPSMEVNLCHCSESLRLICRPLTTSKDIVVTFRVRVFSLAVRIISFTMPVLLLNPSARVPQGISHCSISMFYTPEDRLERQWIWNSRFLVQGDASEAVLSPASLSLEQGTYMFQVLLKNIESEGVGAPPHLCLLSSSDPLYERKNDLIAVSGFFGDVTCEANRPVLEGELHTMIPGAHLNQNNSASYNGIMFDLRSKKEITLEQVFCISQTTSDCVTVRIFWREGSMEGAERAPHQWREVITKEVAVVDKHPFSVGPLMLRMRANQVYSIFINTSSSCGVRFYNSSDGHVGDIRDEFDSDGILSVYVGRKSESSSPFVELPLEPRAFRGRITYRTYALQNTDAMEHATFPYVRGFLVTRMLVALMSYVELSSVGHSGNFSYEQLLKTTSLLATSPMDSLADLMGAENMLASLIRDSGEVRNINVTIPIAGGHCSLLVPLAKGDIALLTDLQSAESNALVKLQSGVRPDGMALVRHRDASVPFSVPAKRLLPITKCVMCGWMYTQEVCAACNAEHMPILSEEARAVEIVANGLQQTRSGLSIQETIEAAVAAVGSAWGKDGMLMPVDAASKDRPEVQASVAPRGVVFSIPVALLLSEEEYSEGGSLLCPFVFHPAAGAAVALRLSTTNEVFSVQFVTSGAASAIAEATEEAPAHFFLLQLWGGDGEARHGLTEDPVPFVICRGGESSVPLVENVHAGYAASLQRDGFVTLFLEIQACSPLPLTAPVLAKPDCWMWEHNSVEAQLCSTSTTYLARLFSSVQGVSDWPHYSAFMVTAKGKETMIFLELHVSEVQRRTVSSSGMMVYSAPSPLPVRIRKPFNMQSDEVLTLRVTTEGDFFIYDTNDIVRCSISKEELYGGKHQRQLHRIGFVSVDPEKVTALLYVPEKTRRNPRANIASDAKTTLSSSSLLPKTYSPAWVRLDASRITVSRNGLTASSVNELGGGDAVMGSPLPATGVWSFVVHIHRKDSQPGTPLGSGFFAGVALSDFAQFAPEYSAIKTYVGSLWVVQDVQDEDSMPNQEPLPPLMRGSYGQGVLFFDSTKLLFIVDRSNGTLSISRDNESPHVVFQGIPHGASVSPFVRLDHPNSSATLARFSSAVEYTRLHQPSLEKVLWLQPITPSLLRRYPLFMATQTFPFISELVRKLPTRLAGLLERCWGEQIARSRFEYRVAQALEELAGLGAFARSLPEANDAKVDEIADYLSKSARREVVVFPARTSETAVQTSPLDDSTGVHVRLPPTYELVGRVEATNMVRVLHFDREFGAVERTLHLFFLDDATLNLHSTNNVLPHLSVMRQHEILPALNRAEAVAVMADGWFDCSLADYDAVLNVKEEEEIASSLVYALEHWHLHQLPHGHVHPRNVYLRVEHGEVVQCCLWNVHQLSPKSKYASHELRDSGVRSLFGDRWACWQILHSFQHLLAHDPRVAECVELMVDEATSISRALQLSVAFQGSFSDSGEGLTFSLRTGSRLRGGSGSYNGIMFDVVAKNNTICITKLSFIPDANTVATVRLYARSGSFMGFERDPEAWTKLFEEEMALKDTWEVTLENFEPITVPGGARVGIFLHTTSGSGVLFFSENEGLQGKTGDVEEENDDIGITIGKKSESANPFVAVQSQKRLLKGSITYTVLMRSNGPRSCLISCCEPVLSDGKGEEQVELRLVQVSSAARKGESDLQVPGGVRAPGGARTQLPATQLPTSSGYCLQVLSAPNTRRSGSDRNNVLTLVAPSQFVWCRAPDVVSVRPGLLREVADPLVRFLAAEGLRRRRTLLRQHNLSSRVFPCRPLHFLLLPTHDTDTGAPSSMCSVTHPVLSGGTVFISEPISSSCTLSLWQKAAGAAVLLVMDHIPTTDEVTRRTTASPSDSLVGARSCGGFVHVDDALRYVTSTRDRVHLRLKASLSCRPLFVVARLRNAGHRDSQLFAYSSAMEHELFTPAAEGCFFMTNRKATPPDDNAAFATTWHACGGLIALEGRDKGCAGAESLVRLESLVSSRDEVRFVCPPRCPGESETVVQEKMKTGEAQPNVAVQHAIPQAPLLIELREQAKWKSVRHLVEFTCLSSSLALCGARGAWQVAGGINCSAVVSSPRFTTAERHRVHLRLQFPRRMPMDLQLDCKSGSANPIRLLHGSYKSLRSRLFDPAVREVFVWLDINLQTREVVVLSSDGTVYHPFIEESVLSSDVQLGFVSHAPGSELDVLEWRVCSSQIRGEMTASVFKRVLEETPLAQLSANTSLTVGTVCRHSARGAFPSKQEVNLSTEKQMGVLMVTYARMLLEKTLLSQEKARTAAQPQFLRLLSLTALRKHPDIARILDGEIKQGSFRLVSQCVAQLSAPFLMQVPAEVDAGINVIASLMRNDVFRRTILNAFGSSLVLILLRAATVHTRSTRHTALHCVQELLSDGRVPLPSHHVLSAHLRPLTDMMASLCRRERMGSAVVQTGVTLIADLIERYQRERPEHPYRDVPTEIPYKLVCCAREIVRAITHDPPLPFPSAMVAEVSSQHTMRCEVMKRVIDAENRTCAIGVFKEEGRHPDSSMSFTVRMNGNRRGSVVVGWNSATPRQQQDESLPCFGYFVDGRTGAVFLCYNHTKSMKGLALRVNAGDDLITTANYRDHKITFELKRAGITVGETKFDTEREVIGLPFFSAEYSDDATVDLKSFHPGPQTLSVSRLYEQILRAPYEQDQTPAQSFEFYAELNLFAQTVLNVHSSADIVSRVVNETTVASHELASFTQVSSALNAGAFAERVSLAPLTPYLVRLKKLDELTAEFAPLINLRRRTELFDIFGVLKNLCSRETEEQIQTRIMAPFQNMQGKKVSVTIHTMQAQPTTSTGPFQTLMRSVFGQLYLQLQQATIDIFYVSPIFTVKLAGFGSTDAGGPYRDVLSQLATEIMTTHPSKQCQLNPLFVNCGRGDVTAIMPNVALIKSAQIPLMLEFFGKLLASLFLTQDVLAVELPPLFWKLLLGEEATIKDLSAFDADIAKLLQPEELMMRTHEELEERFPGITAVWKAIVDDNQQFLLDENLPPETLDGARLLSRRIMVSEIHRFEEAIGYIQQGFDQVLPLYTLHAYRWQKVELLICGTPKLTFADFYNKCDIQLSTADASMFLSVLESMTDEDRTLLLRFTTGQSRLPLKTKIKVTHNGSKDTLPTSSTCFFALRLPSYSSAEKMKERLLYAVRQCKAIDADGQAREHLIID